MRPEQEVLAKAAEYIGEHGWCQGRSMDEEGRVCAMGAINAVLPIPHDIRDLHAEARYLLAAAVARCLLTKYIDNAPGRELTVISWNDDPSRTAEDVILAMKRAAHE